MFRFVISDSLQVTTDTIIPYNYFSYQRSPTNQIYLKPKNKTFQVKE